MTSTNCISRTVRICRWQARVNSLWLWPYCILTLALHGYLMYRAVSRCKDYNELPWRSHDKPVVELYVYIALIVLSVMCVPFFIITSIFKVGNYANDGVRLGRDNIHEQELAEAVAMATIPASSVAGSPGGDTTDDEIHADARATDVKSRRTVGSRLQTIWRHVGPFSHGFHVISAFSLLLPSMLLEAQEIRYGFRNPDTAWRSDLDWMLGRRMYSGYDASRVPANILLEYTSMDSTSPGSPGDAIDAPGRAPDSENKHGLLLQQVDTISPEYINYIIALVFYCVRYSSVFWYTKMSFSIVFLIQLFIITIHFGFSFCGAAILYKFQLNKVIFSDLSLSMPSTATISLYLLANFFLLLSTVAVFNYGFQHYDDRWQKFLRSYAPMYCKQARAVRGCHNYTPHTMASIVLLLVILCRGAIVYDYVIVYRKTGFPIILACIVMDAVYMVSCIGLWFGLTLKQRWDFQIMFARYVMPAPLTAVRVNGNAHPHRFLPPAERTAPNETAMPSQTDGPSNNLVQNENHSSNTPNGKVINVEVDVSDVPTDLHSPGGVLKKEKARRNTSAQRVKFDSSANKNSEKKPSKVDNVDANAKDNRKRAANAKDTIGASSHSRDEELPGNLRRAYSDSTSRGRNRKHDSSSDEYVTESTPENTLTRTYRHSIRDTCGLYFRISRDMSPAPAAHSSPVPVEKRDRVANQSPQKSEILLNPLKADTLYPPRELYSGDLPSENSNSPGEDSILALPLDYSPNDSGVQLRRGHNDRDRNPVRQDSRYSYPLTSPSESWSYGEYEKSPKGKPPVYGSTGAHPVRHSMHLDRPRVHDGSYLNNNFRPHRKTRDAIPWSPDGPIRSGESVPRDRVNTPPPPPRAPKNISDYHHGYKNPRDLRIVTQKADLLNRDSALPSSNETSSNDSNDVLCSQV